MRERGESEERGRVRRDRWRRTEMVCWKITDTCLFKGWAANDLLILFRIICLEDRDELLETVEDLRLKKQSLGQPTMIKYARTELCSIFTGINYTLAGRQ